MTTTNLGLTKPTVGGDSDAWGGELNTDLDLIDARLPKIAFSAYMGSTQSIPDSTPTKVQFGTEDYDVGSYYDNATNYRFTPLVAGYYLITGRVQLGSLSTAGALGLLEVYKNGSSHKRLGQLQNSGSGSIVPILNGSAIVYFNGSTDYAELYVTQTNGGSLSTQGTTSPINFFQAVNLFPA